MQDITRKLRKVTFECKKCGRRNLSRDDMKSDAHAKYGCRNICKLCENKSKIANKKYSKKRVASVRVTDSDKSKSLEYRCKGTPRTVDELLGLCSVDRDAWEVESQTLNSVELASGETSVQVKAKLVKSKEHARAINPINVSITEKFAHPKRKDGDIYKALIIPDSQNGYSRDIETGRLTPFHDRLAWDVCLKIADIERPDLVIFLGDMLDLPEWSNHFFRSPDMYFTTQPAIAELGWWLGRFRAHCSNARMIYIEGNHEKRLTTAIGENLMVAWGLKQNGARHPALSIPNLLALDDIGIEYIGDYPNGRFWINDNLMVSHGEVAKAGSFNTVKAIVDNARCSEIVGHIHRIELASKTVYSHKGPVSYMAFSPGTLALLDGMVPKTTDRVNWQNGCGLVYFQLGDGFFHCTPIPIFSGTGFYNGKIVEGEFDKKELIKATGWETF